jgi:hypothetical protein
MNRPCFSLDPWSRPLDLVIAPPKEDGVGVLRQFASDLRELQFDP